MKKHWVDRFRHLLSTASTDQPYALIDYPNYLNPGDCAIWLGTARMLQAMNGAAPSYVSTLAGFSVADCHRSIGNGTIYFCGGGNFGDLYGKHHRRRLDVVKALPRNPVVFLPLSVAFHNRSAPSLVEETLRALDRPGKVTAFAREAQTKQDLNDLFKLDSTLAPDLAHVLPIEDQPPSRDISIVLRSDVEKTGSADNVPGLALDWRDLPAQRYWNRAGKLLLSMSPSFLSLSVMNMIAERKVANAAKELAKGNIVITDRLHGVILSTELGRPTVAIDNSTGKLSSYFGTWREYLHGLHLVEDTNCAMRLSAELLPSR